MAISDEMDVWGVVLAGFCLFLGIWLLVLYGEKLGDITGDGMHSACLKGDSDKLDQYVLGQGILLILNAPQVACIPGLSTAYNPSVWVYVYSLALVGINIGIWIWGQVQVFEGDKEDCGEFLFQARVYIVLSYFLATVMVGMTAYSFLRRRDDTSPEMKRMLPIGFFVLFMCLWIAIFVEVNVPEIKRLRNWKKGSCEVVDLIGTAEPEREPLLAAQAQFPCCSKQCYDCNNCPEGQPCAFLLILANATPDGWVDGHMCDGGRHCCRECCSTCCTSNSDGHQSCSDCNCYCCHEVQHRCCRIECAWCYQPSYLVDVKNDQGIVISSGRKERTADTCKKWGCQDANTREMTSFLRINDENIFVEYVADCWYDPARPSNFEWSIKPTISRWFLFTIISLFVLLTVGVGVWRVLDTGETENKVSAVTPDSESSKGCGEKGSSKDCDSNGDKL